MQTLCHGGQRIRDDGIVIVWIQKGLSVGYLSKLAGEQAWCPIRLPILSILWLHQHCNYMLTD